MTYIALAEEVDRSEARGWNMRKFIGLFFTLCILMVCSCAPKSDNGEMKFPPSSTKAPEIRASATMPPTPGITVEVKTPTAMTPSVYATPSETAKPTTKTTSYSSPTISHSPSARPSNETTKYGNIFSAIEHRDN